MAFLCLILELPTAPQNGRCPVMIARVTLITVAQCTSLHARRYDGGFGETEGR